MKELSIEEKAKRYDDALRKAKEALDSLGDDYICSHLTKDDVREMYAKFFPELKDSEDGIVINNIKKVITWYRSLLTEKSLTSEQYNEIFAWFEKQGEKKSAEFDDTNAKRMFIKALEKVEEQNNKGYKLTDCDKNSWWEDFKTYASCTVEQNPADKAESKFHEGDWVVYNNDICQIVKREEGCNKLVTVFGIEKELVNERNLSTARLWTIQDAKDGDVLCSEQIILLFKKWEYNNDWNFVIAYAGIDITGKLQITNEHWLISNHAHPATKEGRDLLFAKMKEAGYEWYSDKKELKKIEQKPAWSEEDEKLFNRICDLIHGAAYENCETNEDGKELGEYAKMIRLLKSLKGRVQPKPIETFTTNKIE